MPEKETWSIRLPDDMSDKAHEFKDEKGITKSDAGKRLIEEGLENLQEESEAYSVKEEVDRSPKETKWRDRMEESRENAMYSGFAFSLSFLGYTFAYSDLLPISDSWMMMLSVGSILIFATFLSVFVVSGAILHTSLIEDDLAEAVDEAGGVEQ